MSESQQDSQAKGAQSVARSRQGFSVQPSPLNSVKLDLAIILVMAVVLVIVVDRLVPSFFLQIIFLAAAGIVGMLWLLWRTRRVMRSSTTASQERRGGDGPE